MVDKRIQILLIASGRGDSISLMTFIGLCLLGDGGFLKISLCRFTAVSIYTMDLMFCRRYVAMVEMCSAAGSRECQVSSLLFLVEHALEILYLHFEK